MGRDGRDAIDARPAHRSGMGVDQGAFAIFPDARIGLECKCGRLLAQRFQKFEQCVACHARQAAIIEHRHRGQDDAAIGIVLLL